MIAAIKAQLRRLSADKVRVDLDDEFEPRAGTLVKIEIGEAYWHMMPKEFQELLADLPTDAGSDQVQQAIEKHGAFVWHGPSPSQSRSTSK